MGGTQVPEWGLKTHNPTRPKVLSPRCPSEPLNLISLDRWIAGFSVNKIMDAARMRNKMSHLGGNSTKMSAISAPSV